MANLTRWDPFQDMLSLREAMNQLMEESFVRPNGARGQNFVPALDLSETKDGYLVEAAVPGLKPEDLEITLENNVLTIKADAIKAELEHGVLKLEIPKAEEVKPRKIAVSVGQPKAIEIGKQG